MSFFLKNLFLIFSVFLCSFSFAKIHIEPYFGYGFTVIGSENFSKELYAEQESQLEGLQEKLEAIGNTSYYHGIIPGMRLGYRSLNLAVGLDFTFGYWQSFYKKGLDNFRGQQQLFPVLPGVFASYKLPIFFRVYGTLIPQGIVSIKTQDQSQSCRQSRAMKFGFSYLSLPFLSINLEWMPMFIGGAEHCKLWSHTGSIYGNITF